MDNRRNDELLSQVDAFDGLGDEEFSILGEHFTRRVIPKGEVLIREGEQVNELSIIVSGSVEVLLPKDSKDVHRFSELKLATLGPGEYFGEYSVIDLRGASATVIALEETELLQIGATSLQTVLNGNCEIAKAFYFNLALLMIDRLRSKNLELDLFTAV